MSTDTVGAPAGIVYDPYDRAQQLDPYPVYAALRAESTPRWEPALRAFVVSRFDDVLRVAHDHRTFTSAHGLAVGGGGAVADQDPLPIMIMMDPPHHDRLRSLVSRAFTPRSVAALEPGIRRLAAGLADELFAAGGGDLVADFTAVFPALVIADMLGVDPADRAFFRANADELVRHDPFSPDGREKVGGAIGALFGYLDALVSERLAGPRDDMITALTRAEIDGERLERSELIGFCFLLLVAGTETTTNLLGNAMITLHRHPEVRRRVEAEPDVMAAVVEETLRYESPVQVLGRMATTDCEVGGVEVPAEAQVLMVFGSANRDEAVFDHADRFDIDRRADRHLAFGHGLHFCLGASLARLEGRVGLDELLSRRDRLELVRDEVDWMASGLVRGPAALPVTVT
jgi:cytochrome P450